MPMQPTRVSGEPINDSNDYDDDNEQLGPEDEVTTGNNAIGSGGQTVNMRPSTAANGLDRTADGTKGAGNDPESSARLSRRLKSGKLDHSLIPFIRLVSFG